MTDQRNAPRGKASTSDSELPPKAFKILRKPDKALNPVTIVATVDPDGTPRTAPFGSVRAVTPRLLRMLSLRFHDTYANLCRDGRVSVAVVEPPDIALSIRGRARVVKEQMDGAEYYSILEIDIDEVKNDMVRSIIVDSGISISAHDDFRGWFDAVLGELEGVESATEAGEENDPAER